MNTDEAVDEAMDWFKDVNEVEGDNFGDFITIYEAGELLAAEVKRLRAELADANERCANWEEVAVATDTQLAEAWAELDEMKAAFACPVKVFDISTGDESYNWPGDFSHHRCVVLGSQDEAKVFEAWLRERMKGGK